MKKRYSIILLSFLLLILLKIFSVTYGFFETIINENTNLTSLTTQSEYLAVEYSDGTSIMNFAGDFLFPGDTAEKTFTVENTGEADTTYSILIDNIVNEFTRTQDLRYTLYIDEEEITTGAINNNEVQYLYYNREIAVGAKEEVKFIFEYSETEEIQNEDMNKNINFRFNITSKRNKVETTDDGSVTLISNETTLNNYRIYGNSIQDGTPTPETPIEIETVGEKTKNLFDQSKYTIISGTQQIGFSVENLTIGTKYTISSSIPMTWIKISSNPSGYNSVQYYGTGVNTYTFTMSKNSNIPETSAQYIFIAFDAMNIPTDISEFNNAQIQIEEGSSATDYEQPGYKIPITVSGSNLFNINGDITKRSNDETANSTQDNIITSEGYINVKCSYSANYPVGQWIDVEIGKTYTIGGTLVSKGTTDSNIYLSVETPNKHETTMRVSMSETETTYTHTFTATTNKVLLGFNKSTGSYGNTGAIIKDVFMVSSDTKANYEPFVEPTTYNIYLDEPLRKIGNIYDYIDFKDQMLYRNVEEKEFKGTESWYITETTSDGKYYLGNVVPAGAAGPRKIISNYCTYSNNLTLNTCKAYGFEAFDGWFGINVGLDKYSTVESYKTFLINQHSSGIPLKIYYEKNNKKPFELPEIKLHEYTNVITIDTETSPSTFEVEVTK